MDDLRSTYTKTLTNERFWQVSCIFPDINLRPKIARFSPLAEYHQYNDWFMKMLFKIDDIRAKKLCWEHLVIIGEYFYDFDLMASDFAKQNGLAQPITDQKKFELMEKAVNEVIEIIKQFYEED